MLLFNTWVKQDNIPATWFQNISCYCLTEYKKRIVTQMLLFQNISCYCLTVFLSFIPFFFTQFQNISCYCLTRFLQDISLVDFISKHLMLLFNSIRIIDLLPIPLFQNISCYCLTSYPLEAMRSSQIFQNISCYCLTSLHSRKL